MLSDDAIRTAANAQGFRIKRNNLIAASLAGAILLFVSITFLPHSTSVVGFLSGLLVGLIYAECF